MELSEKIIYYLKQKNMTQKDLAEYLNVTPQAVSKWCNGLSIPDIFLLKELSNLFSVSINDLLDNNIDIVYNTVEVGEEISKEETPRKFRRFDDDLYDLPQPVKREEISSMLLLVRDRKFNKKISWIRFYISLVFIFSVISLFSLFFKVNTFIRILSLVAIIFNIIVFVKSIILLTKMNKLNRCRFKYKLYETTFKGYLNNINSYAFKIFINATISMLVIGMTFVIVITKFNDIYLVVIDKFSSVFVYLGLSCFVIIVLISIIINIKIKSLIKYIIKFKIQNNIVLS